jgi:polysaccharide export outer membrane protein
LQKEIISNIMIKFFTGILLVAALGMQSCSTYKHIPYFQDVPDSARVTIQNAKYKGLVIQPDDQLYINIQTMDPEANAIFNQNMVPSGLSGISTTALPVNTSSTSGTASYLVDSKGEIDIPVLGVLHVGGITTEEAQTLVRTKASEFYKGPSVNIRFANLKVTLLGEVNRPGTYLLTNEKNTIYDALGLAGDLSIFGKRHNMLLVRDSAGNTQMIRFSLNSKDLVKQDFFYLKQNDMIYVEPEKAKIAVLNVDKSRNFAIGASLISLLIVIATRVK